MQYSLAILALAATAFAAPQGVTSAIAPSGTAPAGCSPDHSGSFEITIVQAPKAKRSLEKRQSKSGILTLTLSGGVLLDQVGRTGYIADNYQFQFDKPAQTGAIYTAGFSYCSNGSLALGPSTVFWQCRSGDFYNLYDRDWAPQCEPIEIVAMDSGNTEQRVAPGGVTTAVSQQGDGQPAAVTQINDGQVQAQSALPVTQLADGQPQGPIAVSQRVDGQIIATTTAAPLTPVSQISDGQPQAGTNIPNPVSQQPDGQPIATSAPPAPAAPPVSQMSDGQPIATSAAPAPVVSQISDGQPQAGSAAPAPVTQISDGQPQAPAATTGAPVSEKTDGQPVATTVGTVAPGNATTPAPPAITSQFQGAAAPVALGSEMVAAAVGMVGAIMLL